MTALKIGLEALPAQRFSAPVGGNVLIIELQWMARLEVFRVNIETSQAGMLTAGAFLLPDVDLLATLYPPPTIEYGSLYLSGKPATPDNLGIDNMLVWSDE